MMTDRQDGLDMLTAALAIIVQIQDLPMSAEIMADAGERFGREFVEELLSELVASSYGLDNFSIANDVLEKRAMLSMIRPLPLTWMHTRN